MDAPNEIEEPGVQSKVKTGRGASYPKIKGIDEAAASGAAGHETVNKPSTSAVFPDPFQATLEFSNVPSDERRQKSSVASSAAKVNSRLLLIGIGGIFLVGFVALLLAGIWNFVGSKETGGVIDDGGEKTTASKTPQPPDAMAYIPGGQFMMGSNDRGLEFARPEHPVSVNAFFMDINEVTNEEYKRFVDAVGQSIPSGWKDKSFPKGRAKYPVTGITWKDADAYAQWLGKRLPTEEEWEFAARGTDGRLYPWGNYWDPNLANAGGRGGLREVGTGGTSPYGLFDMVGNAWEWTSSDAKAYPGGADFGKSPLVLKIIRGGSSDSGPDEATTIQRGYYGAEHEKDGYGSTTIRCARSLD
jgi:formylglycine-generating enzyme required for sulfatase activity